VHLLLSHFTFPFCSHHTFLFAFLVWLPGKDTGTHATSLPPDACDPESATAQLSPEGFLVFGSTGDPKQFSMAASDNVLAFAGETVKHSISGVGLLSVFEHDGSSWSEVARFDPAFNNGPFCQFCESSDCYESCTESEEYGTSVATSGDIIVVGNPKDDSCGAGIGDAFVFEKVNGSWEQTAVLRADVGDTGAACDTEIDRFGTSAAVSEEGIIAVGSDYYDSSAIFVFEKTNGAWTQTAVVRPSGDYTTFFRSMSISGDTIVGSAVNTRFDDFPDDGAAFVFEKQQDGSWQETTTLLPPDSSSRDRFGASVSIDGSTIVVGNQNADAFVYERGNTSWLGPVKIPNNNPPSEGTGIGFVSVYGAALVVAHEDLPTARMYQKAGGSWELTAEVNVGYGTNEHSLSISATSWAIEVGGAGGVASIYPICKDGDSVVG